MESKPVAFAAIPVVMVAVAQLITVILLFVMVPCEYSNSRERERERVSSSPKVLYNLHVESFSRVGRSGIAIGHRNQLLYSSNFGGSWKLLGELPEPTLIKQILWIDSRHIVLNASYTGRGRVYYSSDGGKSFTATLTNSGSSQPIVWDTARHTLYAVHNSNRLNVSYDCGRTWRETGEPIPFEQRKNVSHFCSLIAIRDHGRTDLYATSSYPGQILLSSDGGLHWTRIFADSIIMRNREIPMLGNLSDGQFFAVSAEVEHPLMLPIGV